MIQHHPVMLLTHYALNARLQQVFEKWYQLVDLLLNPLHIVIHHPFPRPGKD